MITIYTHGIALPSGHAGWAYSKQGDKLVAGFELQSTPIRIAVQAVVEALRWYEADHRVTVFVGNPQALQWCSQPLSRKVAHPLFARLDRLCNGREVYFRHWLPSEEIQHVCARAAKFVELWEAEAEPRPDVPVSSQPDAPTASQRLDFSKHVGPMGQFRRGARR